MPNWTRVLSNCIFACALLCITSCGRATCDEDHPDVAVARNLPDEDLAELFAEAEKVLKHPPSNIDEIPIKTNLPRFDVSTPAFRNFSDGFASIMLAGCFDHGVYMRLEDINRETGRVVLSWGEGPFRGEQILWSKSKRHIDQ
jgi:hypothetical protein